MQLTKSGSRFGAGFYLLGLLFALLMGICWSSPVADPNPQLPTQALPESTPLPALDRHPRDGNGTLELLYAQNGMSIHNGSAEAQYREALAAQNAANQNFTGNSHMLEGLGVVAGLGAAGYGVTKGYQALMRWRSTSGTMDKWVQAQDVSWMDADGVKLSPDEVKKAMSSVSNYNKIRNAKMADLQKQIVAANEAGDVEKVANYEKSMNMMQKDKFLTEKMEKLLNKRYDTLKQLKDAKEGDARLKLEGELDDTEKDLQKYGWEGGSKNGLTRAEQRVQAGAKDSPAKIAADEKAKQFRRNGKNEMKKADYSDEDFRNDMASAGEDMEKKIDLIENGSKGGKLAKFKQGVKNKFTTEKQLNDLKTEQANMEGRLKNLDEAAGKTYVPAADRVSASGVEDQLKGVTDSIDTKLDQVADMKDYGWFRQQVRKLNKWRSTVEGTENDIKELRKQQTALQDKLSKINTQNAAGEKGQLQNQMDDLDSQIDSKMKQVTSIESDMAKTRNSNVFKKILDKINPTKGGQADLDKLNKEIDQLNQKKAPIQEKLNNPPEEPTTPDGDTPKPVTPEGAAGDAAKPSYSGADRLKEAKAESTYQRANKEIDMIEAENVDLAKYDIKDPKAWRQSADKRYKSLLEERSEALEEWKEIRQKMGKPPPPEPASKTPGESIPEEKPAEEVPAEEKLAEEVPAEEKGQEPVQQQQPAEEQPAEKKPVDKPAKNPPQQQQPAEQQEPAQQQQPAEEKPAEPPVEKPAGQPAGQPESQMEPHQAEKDPDVQEPAAPPVDNNAAAAGDNAVIKAPPAANAAGGDAFSNMFGNVDPNGPGTGNAPADTNVGDTGSGIDFNNMFKNVNPSAEQDTLANLEKTMGLNSGSLSRDANTLKDVTKAAPAEDKLGKGAADTGDWDLSSIFNDMEHF